MRHWLILGSNHRRARSLRLALGLLRDDFDLLDYAPARRTGGEPAYLNAGVLIASDVPEPALRALLRQIESAAGRVRGAVTCTLDIDLVASELGEGTVRIHKPADLQRAYVRALLRELDLRIDL